MKLKAPLEGNMLQKIQKMSATLQVVADDVNSIKETSRELKDAVENTLVCEPEK